MMGWKNKEQAKAYDKMHYQKNKEKIKARTAKYQKEHKVQIREYQVIYRRAHKQKANETQIKWKKRNREKVRAYQNIYQKEWSKRNREKVNARHKAYLHRTHKKRFKIDVEYRKKIRARKISNYYKIPMIECTKCGLKMCLQQHHLNYDKPLEVVILCRECHSKEHEKIREEMKPWKL